MNNDGFNRMRSARSITRYEVRISREFQTIFLHLETTSPDRRILDPLELGLTLEQAKSVGESILEAVWEIEENR